MRQAFIAGFRDATGLSVIEAEEQWAAHSRQLSDSERRNCERKAYAQGLIEGRQFCEMYPKQDRE